VTYKTFIFHDRVSNNVGDKHEECKDVNNLVNAP
jgi:hypothetical protein